VPVASSAASAVHQVPTGALYTLLLLAHVVCAVVGYGAVVVTGYYAGAAARGPSGPRADAVYRYFRPGVNWPARALYGVPVFGFALLAASRGAFGSSDAFVVAGLLLWGVSLIVAEALVWPAERRIQDALSRERPGGELDGGLARDCRTVVTGSVVLAVAFVVASVLMVGKP